MRERLHIHELNRDALRELAPASLVVVPIGATEQHGPHLPVGTDFLVVGRVAEAAAARAAETIPVLLAPVLPYGSSHHHLPWGGTISLSTDTFYRLALDLVLSLAKSGFRRVFLLNGHGGNDELLQLTARDAVLQQDVSVAAASYWTIAREALAATAPDCAYVPGHAGSFETALVLASHADLVALELPQRPDERPDEHAYRLERPGAWEEFDGYTDSPARASADAGHRYLTVIVEAVAEALVDFYKSS